MRNVMRSSWQRQKRPTSCVKLAFFCTLTLVTLFLIIFLGHELNWLITSESDLIVLYQNPTQIEDYSKLSDESKPSDNQDDYSLKLFKPEKVFTNEQLSEISKSQEYLQQFLFTNQLFIHKPLSYKLSNANQLPAEISCNTSNWSIPRSEQKQLFIVINSALWNVKRRARLRSSWLRSEHVRKQVCSRPRNEFSTIRILFAVGWPDGKFKLAAYKANFLPEREPDLLAINLTESYKSLSVKHLALFKWLVEFHKGQNGDQIVVLKCDDDSELDLRQLLNMYQRLSHAPVASHNNNTSLPTSNGSSLSERSLEGLASNWFMCATFEAGTRVLRRQHRYKWSLSRQEFPHDTFPQYCSGLAYLAPLKLLERLLLVARELLWDDQDLRWRRPLWVDDAYVTGVLSASLANKIKFVPLNAYFCYSRAQRAHRRRSGINCMASELADDEQPSTFSTN